MGYVGETQILDRPRPGIWWYRIYLAPSYRPNGWSTSRTLGVSEPVRVVVPR